MATVLESLAVPRASRLSPISASTSSLQSSRVSLKLPEFSGLKARVATQTTVKSAISPSRILRQAGKIVSESSEATAQLPTVNDSTWDEQVLGSALPVLVEFWAPWCGPCRMIEPVIDGLAKEYDGKIKVYKVNTDESPSIATKYGVRSIPTVIVFKNGEKKEAVIGAVPVDTLRSSIEKFC